MNFITLFEIIYLHFMFHHFKTTINFNHPFEYITNQNKNVNQYFKHSITQDYESKICDFGKHSIIILILYLICTIILPNFFHKHISLVILIITFLLSLLNMNAVIYLLPYFVIEILKYLYIL